MKFRKKPVVIEAFQMTPARRVSNEEWPEWMNRAWQLERRDAGSLYPTEAGTSDGTLSIGTLEGQHLVSWNDWIIQGVKGELYPCKPDIFAATYEPVETTGGEHQPNTIPQHATTNQSHAEYRSFIFSPMSAHPLSARWRELAVEHYEAAESYPDLMNLVAFNQLGHAEAFHLCADDLDAYHAAQGTALRKLREVFDALLVKEVAVFGGIPSLVGPLRNEHSALRDAIAELLALPPAPGDGGTPT
jgi:hypothetical protein